MGRQFNAGREPTVKPLRGESGASLPFPAPLPLTLQREVEGGGELTRVYRIL